MSGDEYNDDRITDRLPLPGEEPSEEERVTDRLPSDFFETADDLVPPSHTGRVTDRLEAALAPAAPMAGRLDPGRAIDGRYLIQEGPIGSETGEAQVYLCRDRQSGQEVAVKLYKANLSPKKQVLESLLNLDHPHLMGLRDFGRFDGRFYEVLEYCRGGCLADIAPLSEEALEKYIGPMAEALDFCHRQGIVHRDFKPNNLLFRDEERTQLVIGDFGISSVLPEGRQGKKTMTYMFFTIDYCPPEQLRLRQVGPPADYYSMGITLIELISGDTPFGGLQEDEIVDLHLQGNIPLPEGLSDRFAQLVRGLLRQNPKIRWGYEQVRQWLAGAPIMGRDGNPDREEVYFGREIHYPECRQASNPVLLARNLDRFDAVGELFRGRISLWVKLFDAELAEHVVEIEENYTDRPELGLLKLKHTLDPTLPLVVGDREIEDIPGLIAALRSKDRKLLSALRDAFWDGRIETWIAAVFRDERGKALADRITGFRERFTGRLLAGTLQLLFILDPQKPLNLGGGLAARTPEGVAEALIKKPSTKEAIKAYLFSGQLSAWVEIAFPDRTDDADFINRIAQRYARDREMGIKALLWFLKPAVPFPFAGQRFHAPGELADWIDGQEDSLVAGEPLLGSSLLVTWLWAAGMIEDPTTLDELFANELFSPQAKLETLLRLLNPELPRPLAAVDAEQLAFGDIEAGSFKTMEMEITNKGRGVLSGRLYVEVPGNEVTLAPARIDANITLVEVSARPPAWLSEGVVRTGYVIAETNGGNLQIPLNFRVVKPPPPPKEPEPGPTGIMGKISRLFGS